MSETNIKHYNEFVAKWYDVMLEGENDYIEFYKNKVKDCSEPILEVACGTGRILSSVARMGKDIDGFDSSEHMLAICRKKLEESNFTSNLYNCSMVDFNLNKKYGIIYIPVASFQLLEDFSDALKCLKNIHSHLLSGGKLILDLYNPLEESNFHQQNLSRMLMRTGVNKDGEELYYFENAAFDLKQQIKYGVYKYEIYKDKKLAQTLINKLNMKWYGIDEFKFILENLGYSNVEIDKANILSDKGNSVVYVAHK